MLRGIGAVQEESWTAPDVRRRLQLALAGIWLLDAVLQFQAFMFSRGFSQMLGATAAGNPAVIADPINWSAKIIAEHGAATNAVFAFVQLAIGLGIAWRPTIKLALGASIGWALGVWWFGEGLGGVLSGAGGPANGAPGAVIIYALLAVLLWPRRRDRAAPFVAGRFTGANVARALWLVLWGSLAYMAVLPATRAPKALGGMVSAMASGQPSWLSGVDNHLGAFLARRAAVSGADAARILTSPEARSTSTWLTPGMEEISARTAFAQCSQLIPVTVITLRLIPKSYPRARDRPAVFVRPGRDRVSTAEVIRRRARPLAAGVPWP